nr:hypothetical protein [Kibdelosporangium sp. MJ126-NF4]CEL23345.1 hypothetical protein [Kibdelosporangium sp. MJ126-NF4]CTQ94507.1 hypothetical protein [Kibdelosporangium sp. MJ126-NF4]
MSETTRILLQHLDLLAEHVRYQGEAARDGVPASPAHLEYLATRITSTVASIRSAEREEDQAQEQRDEVFVASIAGRNAARIAREVTDRQRVADYIGRTRLAEVYSFDSDRVYLESPAIGLLEWFYVMDGPKAVTTRVADGSAYVTVRGSVDGHELRVWTNYNSVEARELVAGCAEPSVHLLRRLQIAGAR